MDGLAAQLGGTKITAPPLPNGIFHTIYVFPEEKNLMNLPNSVSFVDCAGTKTRDGRYRTTAGSVRARVFQFNEKCLDVTAELETYSIGDDNYQVVVTNQYVDIAQYLEENEAAGSFHRVQHPVWSAPS